MAFTLINNGTLIDGTGGEPLEDAAVLIEDNKIVAVGAESEITRPESGCQLIDANGGSILPGLIDTHVHLTFEGFDLVKRLSTPFSMPYYQAIDRMRRTLDAGITSVRDAGGADLGMKQAVEQGLVLGPRMQISISVLSSTGGHGDSWLPSGVELGTKAGHPGMPDGICDGVEAVRQKVREILRAGADVIKVCTTGGVLSATDHPEFTQYSRAELEVMVEEAAFRRGTKVMAHAQGAEGIKNAVRAGIHSIEHGIFLDEEAINLMLEKRTYLVPTLLAPIAVLEGAGKDMPEWGVRKTREVIDIHSQSIMRAYEAGVRICLGTDAGVMPHGTNLRELGLLCSIGMSPMEAITAATKTASECLGWQDRVGTIEVGKLADIIITKTDPLADIKTLEDPANISLVMLDGQIVKDTRN